MNINTYSNNVVDELGEIVFWTLHDKRTDVNRFKSTIDNLGISEKNFRENTNKKNFLDAVKEICHRHHYKSHTLSDDKDSLEIALYNIKSANKELDLNHHTTITFYKENNHIDLQGDDVLRAEIIGLYNSYSEGLTDDLIRSFVTQTIRDNDATVLRPTGGVYFIPKYSSDVVYKLKELLNETGSGIIYNMKVPNCANEKSTTMDLASKDLIERLEDVSKFIETSKKEKTVEAFLENVNDIKSLASKYSQLLDGGLQLQNIMQYCTETESKVRARISKIQAEEQVSRPAY